MKKRGQFYILTAVIIASVLIGLYVVKNSVNIAEPPRKLYQYSQQLDSETGAVVDYGLYTGNENVGSFITQGITSTKESYPSMEVYTCFTQKDGNNKIVTCQNYGGKNITVVYGIEQRVITGRGVVIAETRGLLGGLIGGPVVTTTTEIGYGEQNFSFNPSQKNITLQLASGNYTLNLGGINSQQAFFILRVNTTSGDYIATGETSITQ